MMRKGSGGKEQKLLSSLTVNEAREKAHTGSGVDRLGLLNTSAKNTMSRSP